MNKKNAVLTSITIFISNLKSLTQVSSRYLLNKNRMWFLINMMKVVRKILDDAGDVRKS